MQERRENKWHNCLYNRVYAVCTDRSSRCASHTSESHLENKEKCDQSRSRKEERQNHKTHQTHLKQRRRREWWKRSCRGKRERWSKPLVLEEQIDDENKKFSSVPLLLLLLLLMMMVMVMMRWTNKYRAVCIKCRFESSLESGKGT